MKSTIYLLLCMVVAIFPVNASNNTLELPLTINPLLQDGVEKGSRINPWISSDKEYYSEITFSDFITKLKLKPDVQAKKAIYPLFLLILAAKLDGLSRHDFKFLQRSKWSINMTADDFANVSADIALPVKDNVTLIAVQKAMFKVLEKRFQFTTEEVAEGLNMSKVEIYSCLEPGWIKIVHFITQKNIFRLTQAYDIPPSYIAKSLNMTLVELENSTLPQLEVILNEKLHIIKEAAQRLRRTSSIAGSAAAFPSPTYQMLKTSSIINNNMPTKIINKTVPMTEQSTYIQVISKNGTITKTSSLSELQSIRLLNFSETILGSSSPHGNKSTNFPGITITHTINEHNTQDSMFPEYYTTFKYPTFTTSTTKATPIIVVTSSTSTPTESQSKDGVLTKTQSTPASILKKKKMSTHHSLNSSVSPSFFPDMISAHVSKMLLTTQFISPGNVNSNTSAYERVITEIERITSSRYVIKKSTPSLSTKRTTISTGVEETIFPKFITVFLSSEVSYRSSARTSSPKRETKIKQLNKMSQTATTPTNFLKTTLIVVPSLNSATTTISASWKSSTPRLWSSKTSLKKTLAQSTQHSTDLKQLYQLNTSNFAESRSTRSSNISFSRNVHRIRSSLFEKLTVITSERKPASVVLTTPSSVSGVNEATNARTDDNFDPVIYVVVPVTAILVLVALGIGIVLYSKNRHMKSSGHKKADMGSMGLSKKGLVESLENINKNRNTELINKGAEERPSRSMSRASSISNLETIHEANEPDEPEVTVL